MLCEIGVAQTCREGLDVSEREQNPRETNGADFQPTRRSTYIPHFFGVCVCVK